MSLISSQELVTTINEHPGLSAYELGEHINAPANRVSTRLSVMCNARVPLIKKVKVDAINLFYPFNYKVEIDPLNALPHQTIGIDGEPIRIYTVAAEDVAQLGRKQATGKYAEMLDVLDNLELGVALCLPLKKVNYHGATDAVHKMSRRGDKKFTTHKTGLYLTIQRIS